MERLITSPTQGPDFQMASGSKAPVDQNPPLTVSLSSTLPVMGMSASSVVKPLVGSSSKSTFPKEPLPTASAVLEKGEGEWLDASRARGKHQTAGPQSPEVPRMKDINRLIPSTSVKCDAPAIKENTSLEKMKKVQPWIQEN